MNENSNDNMWNNNDSPIYHKKVRTHTAACTNNNNSINIKNNTFPNSFNEISINENNSSSKKNKKFRLKRQEINRGRFSFE